MTGWTLPLSLGPDEPELLHLLAFVHTSVLKWPRFDFVVDVVNVTHICADHKWICQWSISADQNWLALFLGGTYMSVCKMRTKGTRHGLWGLWLSWFMKVRGIKLTSDSTVRQPLLSPFPHSSQHWLSGDDLTQSHVITWYLTSNWSDCRRCVDYLGRRDSAVSLLVMILLQLYRSESSFNIWLEGMLHRFHIQ